MKHLYTGDGKGKTTAALGLACRAAGNGMSVCIVQFLKGSDTSELNSLSKIPEIRVLRNRVDCGFLWEMNDDQKADMIANHNDNLADAIKLIKAGKCQVLVLDEFTYVCNMQMAKKDLIAEILSFENIELVITGRDADEELVKMCDYISEMKMIKHPFTRGVKARRGIEF